MEIFMEPLGYLLAMLGLSAAKAIPFLAGDAAQKVLDAAWGGSVEELLEWLMKWITPNSCPYLRKGRLRRNLILDIAKYSAGLDDAERRELAEFLSDFASEKGKEDKGKSYNIWMDLFNNEELTAPPAGDDEKSLEEYEKRIKRALKSFKRHVSSEIKEINGKIGKEQERGIAYVGVEGMTRRIFGAQLKARGSAGNEGAIEAPASVIKIVEMVNDYFFEVKYISLGNDERDVVKVMQKMVEDSNLRLLDSIREELDLITQHNANPSLVSRSEVVDGRRIRTTNLSELAKTDPYLFVRLECPSCHSTGGAIVRNGESARCNNCGERFEIIRNVKEFEDILLKTEERLSELIRSSGEEVENKIDEAKDEIKAELKSQTASLARAIVSNQYATMARAMLEAEKNKDEILYSLTAVVAASGDELLKGIDERLSEIGESFAEKMKEGNEDVIVSISEVIKGESARIEAIGMKIIAEVSVIKENQEHEQQDHRAMLDALSRVVTRMDEGEITESKVADILSNVEGMKEFFGRFGMRLTEISKNINEGKAREQTAVIRYCPNCESDDRAFILKGEHYRCQACGYGVKKADIGSKGLSATEGCDVTLISDDGDLYLNNYLDSCNFITDGKERTQYRIFLNDSSANTTLDDCNDRGEITVISSEVPGFNPSSVGRIILLTTLNSSVGINGVAIRKLVELFGDGLKDIVFGHNVKYQGDAVLEVERGSEWLYSKLDRRLSRQKGR